MRILVLAIASIFISFPAVAQSSQVVFDEANVLFENGELTQAMSLYNVIEQSGRVSGALYLNMGITAVQLDSVGLAKYYFLKAREFEETIEQAEAGIDYVQSQFSRKSATLPKLPWDRAVEWMIEVPTAFGVLLFGFIIVCISIMLLFLYWFKGIQFKNITWYISTLLLVGSVIAGLSFYVDYVDRRYDEGVLVSTSSRVLQSPQTESNLVSIAYEGYNVTIDQWKSAETNNWLYIRLGNGQYGWIENEGVKVL